MSSDPSTTPSHDSLVGDTLDEHARCMEAVARVEGCLEQRPDMKWVQQLLRELPPMLDTMRCHFSEEAQSPLFREIPIRFPRFAGKLAELEREHAEIVRATQAAVIEAESLEQPETYELHELNARVRLLIAKIRRHEAEENEIVIAAHWDTLGVGD